MGEYPSGAHGHCDDLVSIVIPVYNSADYLADCMASVLAQTYETIEVLLVDDGSTDDSSSICDDYAANDARVKAFHRKNSGAAASRNYGIGVASGKWIAFVDSDDLVSPLYIETLLRAAMETGSDIASFTKPRQFRDAGALNLVREKEGVPQYRVLAAEEMLERTFYQEFETGPVTKLFNRGLVSTETFPVGNYYEDLGCMYKLIDRCSQVAVIDTTGLYGYRVNEGGKTSAAFSNRKAKDILETTEELFSYISVRHPSLVPAVSSRCFSACRAVFAQLPVLRRNRVAFDGARDQLWRAMVEYRHPVLFDGKARMREKAAVAISYLGETAFQVFCYMARRIGLMR